MSHDVLGQDRAMIEARACPQCGSRARVDIVLRHDERGAWALARVYCTRPHCPATHGEAVQPHSGLGLPAARAAEVARHRAVTIWNLEALPDTAPLVAALRSG